MHIHFDLTQLNWLAIVIATAAAFFWGGIWYGPIFGRQWMAEFGFKEEDLQKGHSAKIFATAIALTFVVAFMLAMFMGQNSNWMYGAHLGFAIGLGCVAMFIGINYVFEQRSLKLFIINALYAVVTMTMMGAIIGAM